MKMSNKFEDTKEVIRRSHQPNEDGQYNGHKKYKKKPTMTYKPLHKKLKIEQHCIVTLNVFIFSTNNKTTKSSP